MAILKFFVVLFLLKISATSTYPILLRCFSSIVAVYLMFGWKQGSKSEPYGSFHIELNRLPGSPKDVAPETEWLNMGYWKDADVFPIACEALALKLVIPSCVAEGRILDVGHADGDSLLLQLNHPDVPKPSSVTGITSIKSQHVRASERLQLATSRKPGKIEVKLYQGDAVFRPSATSSHPLDPNSDIPAFTTIIALDCAYHFRSRYTFLSQCFRRLESGGKIALGDMCLSSSNPAPSLKRSLIQMAMSIPSENMIPKAQYRDQLEELGYQDIVIEDVSNDVFGPFADFLGKRGIGWWLFSKILRAWWKTGVAFVMVSATKP